MATIVHQDLALGSRLAELEQLPAAGRGHLVGRTPDVRRGDSEPPILPLMQPQPLHLGGNWPGRQEHGAPERLLALLLLLREVDSREGATCREAKDAVEGALVCHVGVELG